MVKCGCKRIREIPIHFSNRVHGSSKLSIKEQINYLRHLRRLYWYKLWARK
jgi:dolichol-phosphate mannosyltransferase